jgi:hypothetical protein
MFNKKGFEKAEDEVAAVAVEGTAAAEVENGSRSSIEGYLEPAPAGEGFIHCPNMSFIDVLGLTVFENAGTVMDREGVPPGTENADSKVLDAFVA